MASYTDNVRKVTRPHPAIFKKKISNYHDIFYPHVNNLKTVLSRR